MHLLQLYQPNVQLYQPISICTFQDKNKCLNIL